MIPGLEIAIGYLGGWMYRKAKRVGGQVDGHVDAGLEAAGDRFGALVERKLAGDSALTRLEREAKTNSGAVSSDVASHAVWVVQTAADEDDAFAAALTAAIRELQQAVETAAGPSAWATGPNATAVGQATITADRGGIAALSIGTVNNKFGGGETPDPPTPGQTPA